MKLRYVELPKAIFLNGKNLGEKLDVNRLPGLSLNYDEKKNRIEVVYNNKLAYILNVTNIPVEPLTPVVQQSEAI